MPLAYSQEFYYVSSLGKFGTGTGQLSGPTAIALDQKGNVYVADTANNRIQVFSSNGTFISQWGEYGGVNGTLKSPEGIAVDPSSGNVYVADTANNRIQVFSSNGTFISKWGGYGGLNGTLRYPQGIALDQKGNVYVADTANNRIQVFSSNGTFISKLGGYGGLNGTLKSPEGIAVDQKGNVYVADTGNNRIQVFSSNGTFISKWGGYGGLNGTLRYPQGIALDQKGNVYVADTGNNRIQVFSSNGTFISKLGGAGGLNGTLRYPQGIALDQKGNVYVADTGNNRIQVFSSNGTFISKLGGAGAAKERILLPEGIAVDPSSGNVYVADTANNRISSYTSRSPISNVSFSSKEGVIYGNDTRIKIEPIYQGLKFPTAIAFLGPDDIVVLEKNEETIRRIVNGQMLDEPALDLRNTTKINGCMCDIAILQNENNGTSYAFVYFIQAEVPDDNVGPTKPVNNSVYRYDITNGKFTNPKLIFEISRPTLRDSIHNGGKLMIGPDDNIYLTTGDFHAGNFVSKTEAQNVKNGSLPDGSSGILRFTPDGEAVDGGLLGQTSPLDKYYAYGIRNSFGLNYDPITGNIWMTDNGPAHNDELNIVMPGFNSGWNKIIGKSSIFPRAFNSTDLQYFNGTGKYYDPSFDWYIPIGVTDLVFVPSDKLGKEYEGNLFVGDIISGYLYRFVLNQSRTGLLLNSSLSDGVADNFIEKLEAVLGKINGGGITDLEIGPDGLIYIVSSNGKIMRLEPIGSNVTLPLIETTNATQTGGAVSEAIGATGDGGGDRDANTTRISIVPTSSELTDTAFEPNPVEVKAGDIVAWTNDDSTSHTVTSGENGQPDGMFDSSIMAPQQTFEHAFTEGAGDYPYFCLLHPNMVGTVSVIG